MRTAPRSEEHTSELQSRFDLVCHLIFSSAVSFSFFPYTTLFRSKATGPLGSSGIFYHLWCRGPLMKRRYVILLNGRVRLECPLQLDWRREPQRGGDIVRA